MDKYYFFKDEKVAAWYRTYFTVEADSIEEAIEKIKSDPYDLDFEGVEITDSQFLDDLTELISTNVEGGPTLEIFEDDGDDPIYSNYE
jgi:hypothetical protein